MQIFIIYLVTLNEVLYTTFSVDCHNNRGWPNAWHQKHYGFFIVWFSRGGGAMAYAHSLNTPL